jgi:hypothetical protein
MKQAKMESDAGHAKRKIIQIAVSSPMDEDSTN